MSKGPITHIVNGGHWLVSGWEDAAAELRRYYPGGSVPPARIEVATLDGQPLTTDEARESLACGGRCDEPAAAKSLAERVRTRRLAMGYPRVRDLANKVLDDAPPLDAARHDAAVLGVCALIDKAERGESVHPLNVDELADVLEISSFERDEWHAANGALPLRLLDALCARPELWNRVRDLLATPRGRSVLRPETPAPYSSKSRR
jgi:hypothetical protein